MHIISKVLFAAVLLSIVGVSIGQYCGPWPVLPIDSITLASPNDTIFIHYLAAPLMYCSVKDELTRLNGYHGGLGLENTKTGYSITFNYDAYPSFFEAVFPAIIRQANGTVDLVWSEGGQVYTYLGINYTYWHCGSQHVANMTGAQFNNFIKWMAQGNTTFTAYNTLAVYKSFPKEPWLIGFECFEFVFECIAQAQRMGAVLLPGITKLKQSIANVYTNSKPIAVDFNDPKHHNDIIDYFEMLERMYNNLGVVKFIEQLFKLFFEGDCYVHYGGQYYYVDVSFPYFEQHWVEMPLINPNASSPFNRRPGLNGYKPRY